MKNVAFTAFVSIMFFNTVNICAQPDNNLWNGHRCFAGGDYDSAAYYYQADIDAGNTWDWMPEMIQTVNLRKSLGNITPGDTHRILSIFVVELNQITDSGIVTETDISPEKINEWVIVFGVMKKTIEAWSNGDLTLEFDTISAISTYDPDDGLKPDHPDHLNLENLFFKKMYYYDSFSTLSKTRSPAYGLATNYAYIHNEIYGPHRGWFAVNGLTHGFPTYLHEFFHTVEWATGVANGVTHGYLPDNRIYFPDWTGNTEYDYYRWHFATTLPDTGWNKFIHTHRWIPFHTDTVKWQQLFDTYSPISLYDRMYADTLANEASALLATDTVAALIKFDSALALSPYHQKSLLTLYDYHRFSNPDTAQQTLLYGKLKFIRDIQDWYTIEPENDSAGTVCSMWHPEDITTAWTWFEWDISDYLSQDGNYDFTFYYTGGWKALQMDSVSVNVNNVYAGSDNHVGFSGTAKTDHIYHLGIPVTAPITGVTLRAKIKGSGGTDSHGQIHLNRVSNLEVFNAEYGHSITVSPNPFHNKVHFSLGQNFKKPSIRIFDICGRKILSENNICTPEHILHFDNLKPGLYLYKILDGDIEVSNGIIVSE